MKNRLEKGERNEKKLRVIQFFVLSSLFIFFPLQPLDMFADMGEFNQNLPVKDKAYWSEMEDLKPKVESYVNSVASTDRVGGHKTPICTNRTTKEFLLLWPCLYADGTGISWY